MTMFNALPVRLVGVGVVLLSALSGGAPAQAADPGLTYYLKDGNSAGSPTYSFGFGPAGSKLPILGDWDGNGTDTVGLSMPSGDGRRWVETNYNAASGASAEFTWGNAGCTPISGDWDGDGTTSIGAVGGWSLGATPPSSNPSGLRGTIVAKAQSQLGVSETGSNCNPYGPCEYWCALFATWVWRQAGVDIPSYGFTGDIYTWGQQHGLVRSLSQIQPGDIVLFGTGPQDASTSVHTGIVEQVLSNGTIITIEGNYSDKVSRVGPYNPSNPAPSGWHDSRVYGVVAPA